ncbi:MAG: hypothetical protein ACK478_11105 [Flavobacteriales bacterium]|jgi:hypothetical protein
MKTIEQMPPHSRVWVYQASCFLTQGQEDEIKKSLAAFLSDWTSHGASMDAAGAVYHHRVVVIAADEQQAAASGCGIDKSVHFMQGLGQEMGVDFFQRTTVVYQEAAQWKEAPMHQFWALRKAGVVGDETPILDTTVRSLGELQNALVVPFGRSWHKDMWGR